MLPVPIELVPFALRQLTHQLPIPPEEKKLQPKDRA